MLDAIKPISHFYSKFIWIIFLGLTTLFILGNRQYCFAETASDLVSKKSEKVQDDLNKLDLEKILDSINLLVQTQMALEAKLAAYEKKMTEDRLQVQLDAQNAVQHVQKEFRSITENIDKQKNESDRLFKISIVIFPFLALIVGFIPLKYLYDISNTKKEIDAIADSLKSDSEAIEKKLSNASDKLVEFEKRKNDISKDLFMRAEFLLEQTQPGDAITDKIAAAAKLLSVNDADRMMQQVARAFIYEQKFEWNGALSEWENLIKEYPEYVKGFWGKVNALEKIANMSLSSQDKTQLSKDIFACLDKIIALDSQSYEAHFQKGEITKRLADGAADSDVKKELLQSASTEYRETSNLYPTWEKNLQRLGKTQIERANPIIEKDTIVQSDLLKNAIRFYKQLLELNPQDLEALMGLGYCNYKLATEFAANQQDQSKLQKIAETYFAKADKIQPFSTRLDKLQTHFTW